MNTIRSDHTNARNRLIRAIVATALLLPLVSITNAQNGSIVVWGSNVGAQHEVPSPNTDFIAVAAGSQFSIGLKANYGACCVNTDCMSVSEATCLAAGGTYQGDNTPCAKISCTTSSIEDINGDGEVNVADLLQLIGAWGSCSGCPEDINDDGNVNVTDLLQLIAAWGSYFPSPPL